MEHQVWLSKILKDTPRRKTNLENSHKYKTKLKMKNL